MPPEKTISSDLKGVIDIENMMPHLILSMNLHPCCQDTGMYVNILRNEYERKEQLMVNKNQADPI